jgi:hypothetical protein
MDTYEPDQWILVDVKSWVAVVQPPIRWIQHDFLKRAYMVRNVENTRRPLIHQGEVSTFEVIIRALCGL